MILQTSWREYDNLILSLGRREKPSHWNESQMIKRLMFLSDIGFWDKEKDQLTQQGELYFNAKYVLQDQEKAGKVLRETLMNYPPVQYICQTFWGRKTITREQVENLLTHLQVLDKGESAASLLALLNYAGIVTYSKGTSQIRINVNPIPEDSEASISHKVIVPETPYSNIKNIRQAIRSCKGFVWWLDKHFDKKGLEPLAEECDANLISETRILSGIYNVTENTKKDYELFQIEMNNKGIKSEWRVILDKDTLSKIHDRFIISKDVVYNVPPVNTIYKGQLAEISRTNFNPDFESYWSSAKEMLGNWSEIKIAKG